MREILFRGKRTDTKEWIEGVAFPHDNTKVTILSQYPMDGSLVGKEVDPETVGQFTGLIDKNGKKIFEGDIIEHKGKRYSINYLLHYARFLAVTPNNAPCVFAYQYGEVIGNIYDNPELLESVNVDFEPIRHGRWVHDGGGYDGRDNWYHCSECNRTLNLICGKKIEDYPYCHCGAKMDGGEYK